jgi:hypothetical protein
MRRITEEAKAVLNCYDATSKQELIQEIESGIEAVEEPEMREVMNELLTYLRSCTRSEYIKLREFILLDVSEEDAVF